MTAWISLGLLIIAGVLLVVRHDTGPIAGLEAGEIAALISGVALLIFIGAPAINRYRGRNGAAARDAAIWAGLGLLLVAGYTMRTELKTAADRVITEFTPAGRPLAVPGVSPGEIAVRIRMHQSGQFLVDTEINGIGVSTVVDTGASNVVLTQSDAGRLGLLTDSLSYSVPVSTANGMAFSAPALLDRVMIGDLRLDRVEALIAKPGTLDKSLLGMSFLRRLRSYKVAGDMLTLEN